MKIGEFSRQCGVSVRMLRFYETAGLLMPRRTAQGWREYDAADAVFIRKAAQLNRAGVPLKDLALMRDCLRDEPQQFCAELRARLGCHAGRFGGRNRAFAAIGAAAGGFAGGKR